MGGSDGVSEMVPAASIAAVRRDVLLYSAVFVARTVHRVEFASSNYTPAAEKSTLFVRSELKCQVRVARRDSAQFSKFLALRSYIPEVFSSRHLYSPVRRLSLYKKHTDRPHGRLLMSREH
jgi:hypothetical protein